MLLMIVPSRGRPQNAARINAESPPDPGAHVLFAVDSDDPTRESYPDNRFTCYRPPHNLVQALNETWARNPGFEHYGFMGDDHQPRTEEWGSRLCKAAGDGMAYGNDLCAGPGMPTAIVMHHSIPDSLGYMAPPSLQHLWVDSTWKAWGRAAPLTYRAEIVVEHLHPLVHKTDWDAGYLRVNSPEQNDRDLTAFQVYQGGPEFERDLEILVHRLDQPAQAG